MSEGAPLPTKEFCALPPDEAGDLEALVSSSFLSALHQFVSDKGERFGYVINGPQDDLFAPQARALIATAIAMSSLILLNAGIPAEIARGPLIVGEFEIFRNAARTLIKLANR